VSVPARRTRPRNRRALILDAAAALFAERGYGRVGMSDIADAVAVGPSALYGHFRSKQELLHATILAEFAPGRAVIAAHQADGLDAVLRALAAFSLDHRSLGPLWQREIRYLNREQRATLLDQIRETVAVLAELLVARRPELAAAQAELLVSCVLSVLLSSGQHRLTLPRPAHDELMADLSRAVLSVRPQWRNERSKGDPVRRVLPTRSRRESILEAAIALFAARGYETTGIDDIGAVAGIAGPSVYHHFASKIDLLIAAVTRATEGLRIDMSRVLSSSTDARTAIVGLVRAYSAFALANSALLDVVTVESRSLPDERRRETQLVNSEYVGEWVHLLRATTGVSDVSARIRVTAALSMINDLARTPHLRAVESIEEVLILAAASLLFAEPSRSPTDQRPGS
jgi:AcrR family transcriptional regulator